MRKSETCRNELWSYISNEYGRSRSVREHSGKLEHGSLRYGEAVEPEDAPGYEIVRQKRGA